MKSTESQPQPFIKRAILHPFAFALFPLLSLYSQNLGQAIPVMVLISALLILSGVSLLFLMLSRVLHKRELAGLLVSLLVLFLFSYGWFSLLVLHVKFGNFVFLRNMHRIPLYTGLFLIAGFGIYKLSQRWSGLTKFLNVSSLSLVLVSLLTLGYNSIFGYDPESPLIGGTERGKSPSTRAEESLPDIYYIILDGYGSSGVLNKYFGYDNSLFTDFLKAKGFFLPAQPRSNYGITALSLGSSLSMDYLHDERLMKPDNKAERFAEAHGYEYIGFSSMKPRISGGARKAFAWRSLMQNEFILQLLRTTVMDPVALRCNIYAYTMQNNILSCLETLKALPERPGKKFVFVHILCPHPPYVFKADGSSPKMSLSEANLNLYRTPWDNLDGYVQQVRFLNTRVTEMIEALLAKSKVPPVIILQGDHGPKLTAPDRNTAVDMHMHILNAYYLPGTGRTNLYDTITPVNSFRVVFNQYLKAGLPLLEDKCYFSDFETPFVFTDVTAQTRQ